MMTVNHITCTQREMKLELHVFYGSSYSNAVIYRYLMTVFKVYWTASQPQRTTHLLETLSHFSCRYLNSASNQFGFVLHSSEMNHTRAHHAARKHVWNFFLILYVSSFQRHLVSLPQSVSQDSSMEKFIMRRRRKALKTMEDMEVLDYMPGRTDKKKTETD
jgi:hypothetical protein